jgi:hypothetical protein
MSILTDSIKEPCAAKETTVYLTYYCEQCDSYHADPGECGECGRKLRHVREVIDDLLVMLGTAIFSIEHGRYDKAVGYICIDCGAMWSQDGETIIHDSACPWSTNSHVLISAAKTAYEMEQRFGEGKSPAAEGVQPCP